MKLSNAERGRRSKDERRVPLSMRITPQTRERLVSEATATGRSLTQEAEFRLEHALARENLIDQVFDLAYRDPHLVAMLLFFGEAMRDTIDQITSLENRQNAKGTQVGDWINKPYLFNQVADAIRTSIEGFRPAGDPTAEQPASVKGQMITGRSIVGGLFWRLLGDWSQHYPWPQIRSRVQPKITDRIDAQWKQVVGPTTAVVPHPEDLDRVSKKRAATSKEGNPDR